MVGVFERVFAAGNVYRAEKHSTTRHLNEYTSLDMEMGFIENFRDICVIENRILACIMGPLAKKSTNDIALLGARLPEVPSAIPSITLHDAQVLISKETGIDCTQEPDLEPAQDRKSTRLNSSHSSI